MTRRRDEKSLEDECALDCTLFVRVFSYMCREPKRSNPSPWANLEFIRNPGCRHGLEPHKKRMVPSLSDGPSGDQYAHPGWHLRSEGAITSPLTVARLTEKQNGIVFIRRSELSLARHLSWVSFLFSLLGEILVNNVHKNFRLIFHGNRRKISCNRDQSCCLQCLLLGSGSILQCLVDVLGVLVTVYLHLAVYSSCF